MKKICTICCLAISLVAASSAMAADSIQGRLGVTGRIGFLVPSDSEAFDVFPSKLDTDVGFVGGGGLIYGITRNIAAEVDVTHTWFNADLGGVREGDFNTTNLSLGGQYRFTDIGTQRLVPYLGAGLDILFSDFSPEGGGTYDIDTVAGVHLSGGADYFLMKQLALTAEVKGVIAPDADIKAGGAKIGNYDPTSLSMTVGLRYFFN